MEVLVPGPWWSSLSYRSQSELSPGCRVAVPIGRTKRVGFVLSCSDTSTWPENKVRSISSVLDDGPVMPSYLWRLSHWVGKAFLCGQGQALMAMIPKEILSGEELPPWKAGEADGIVSVSSEVSTCYRWLDRDRIDRYISMIQTSSRTIVAFPDHQRAQSFLDVLAQSGLNRCLLWPRTGGSRKLREWMAVRDGEYGVVVGGPGVMSAPLDADLIIVEDEGNDAYRLMRHPKLNARSVLSRMAKETGAKLVLGGRIPSSRVFRGLSPEEEKRRPGKRLVFVDVKEGHSLDIPGALRELPLAQSTMERTIDCVSRGRVAIWILDRKGYVGDLRCEECGASITCPCGGSFRVTGKAMSCFICGRREDLPELCPECGGAIITGQNPGIDALIPAATSLIPGRPVVLWSTDEPKGKAATKERVKSLSSGGLVLGTRKSLELCAILDVGLVCWLDGDGEARRPDHGARHCAYTMVSESCWGGLAPLDRQVVLQSRNPGRGWQGALSAGWTVFWERELRERADVEMPPFRYLAEVSCLGEDKDRFSESIALAGGDVMDPDPKDDRVWVAFIRLSSMYRAMEEFFSIGSRSYPKVVLWTD
ncbi:MAG: hypothetical protein PHU72_00420 [Dethiosulfovibrio sp.]|nr:hypothetical protein [Dethiosulfovibrio sp.]